MVDERRVTGSDAGRLDVAVVGAGFAGLYMLLRLRRLGFSVRVFEAGSDVGGTWYWNRYPGARCDVESMQYSYSFDEDLQQEWSWSERFATQPEILRYINHVADRFDLRRDIQFNTRIESMRFDGASNTWALTTDDGNAIEASFCVMATGCLSAARMPDIKGRDDFKGAVYHTGAWPHEGVDFSGLRVAVVGTGSSGIQAIPEIAKLALSLHVFQRTPNFSIPARNAPLTSAYVNEWKSEYAERRRLAREETRSGTIYDFATKSALEVGDEERQREYAARWKKGGANFMHSYNDLAVNETANKTAADFVRDQIRATVKDPAVAETLCPYDYPIFTKRICIDSDYFETFNRDNVTLVDLRKAPITEITPHGIRTSDRTYDFDAIVFATGFDAMTGALTSVDIRGVGGESLKEKWAPGPRAYLGLISAGFPNLFMVTGPGSPSVLSNVVVSIEQHVDWIADCINYLRSGGIQRIDASRDVEDKWVNHVNEVANTTLYPRAASWYMGANIPGKTRVFMPYIGGVGAYRQTCTEIARSGYEGFLLGNSVSP